MHASDDAWHSTICKLRPSLLLRKHHYLSQRKNLFLPPTEMYIPTVYFKIQQNLQVRRETSCVCCVTGLEQGGRRGCSEALPGRWRGSHVACSGVHGCWWCSSLCSAAYGPRIRLRPGIGRGCSPAGLPGSRLARSSASVDQIHS